jgi:8-oxo-dGTP diphosphatase
VAVIFQRNPTGHFEVLATFRAPDGPRADLWEFPGGKVEPGETTHDAARREVQEELDIELDPGAYVATTSDHDPSQVREQHVRVHGFAFDVTRRSITPRPAPAQTARWIPVERFEEHDWPPASRKLFTHFKAWLAQTQPKTQPPN